MSIGTLKIAPVPVLEGDEYQPPAERKPIPDDGEYTLRLPDTFPEDAFEEDKRRDEAPPYPLQVVTEPKIIGDREGEATDFDGTTLRFQRASTRFLKFRKSSTLADQLMAIEEDPRDMEGMSGEDAVGFLQDTLSGREFFAYVRWESSFVPKQGADRVYLRGMKQHDAANLRRLGVPLDKDIEGPQPKYPSPWEKDEAHPDQPKLVFANARIGRYIMPDPDEG